MSQYLTFLLGDEYFALNIDNVIEIVGIQKITKMPQQPDYIKGVINLRGKIIPMSDVRIKFGKEAIPYDERTCIIVLDIGNTLSGFIVDSVDEVMTIDDELISEPPGSGNDINKKYVNGIVKRNDAIIMLLDSEKLANEGDASEMGITQEIEVVPA